MIWYRGTGKFYEYKNDEWVVAYDLNNMPTQEEQEELVAAIQEKNPEFVVDEDKSLLPQILSEILNLAAAPPEKHVLEILSIPEEHETIEETLARMKLDGRSMRTEDFPKLDVLNTYLMFNGIEYAITQYVHNEEGTSVWLRAGFASILRDTEATLEIQIEEDDSYVEFSES